MSEVGTIVIVGAGLAGAKAAEALRKEGFDGRVRLLGAEPHRPYLRPPLSKEHLRGEGDPAKVFVHPEEWYAEQRVELEPSTAVRAIDPAAREVVLDGGQGGEGGRRVGFDRLLLATGSEPRRLTVPGADLPGVHHLRTIDDSEAIRAAAAKAGRAVVIGGGWIGSEVAASLRQLGLPVTLVLTGEVPLQRVVGPEVGGIYRDLHLRNGVEIVPRQRVVAVRGTVRAEGVETADGTRIDGDLVVVGIGAAPRTQLAEEAGLEIGNGVHVDEHLATSAPGIYAAGDIAAAWHPLFGTRLRVEHWDNARRQGRAAALGMMGRSEPYERVPYFYSDQFDLGMEYSGYAPAWDRVVFRGDPAGGSFVAFWLRDGRVVAGMNANVWKVNDAIAALVASGRQVALDRLTDPAIPIAEV